MPDDERWLRAQRGLQDLEAWLNDVLGRGLAASLAEDPQFYLTAATRLADASLRSLSRRMRTAGEAFAQQPDQPEPFLATLAEAAIAVQAFRRREYLSEAQRADLEAFLGLVQKKETVRQLGERLDDTWAVVGATEETLEASLRERRTWLLGAKSGRFALLLDYTFGSEGFGPGFEAGQLLKGVLAYYPSAWPLRALPIDTLQTIPQQTIKKLPGWDTFTPMAQTFAQALSQNPWLSALPAIVLEVMPVRQGKGFVLVDVEGQSIPLRTDMPLGWALIAASEGKAVTVFGEWNGENFLPLSAISQERFINLSIVCTSLSSAAVLSD